MKIFSTELSKSDHWLSPPWVTYLAGSEIFLSGLKLFQVSLTISVSIVISLLRPLKAPSNITVSAQDRQQRKECWASIKKTFCVQIAHEVASKLPPAHEDDVLRYLFRQARRIERINNWIKLVEIVRNCLKGRQPTILACSVLKKSSCFKNIKLNNKDDTGPWLYERCILSTAATLKPRYSSY